jgi:hypothetical protein
MKYPGSGENSSDKECPELQGSSSHLRPGNKGRAEI